MGNTPFSVIEVRGCDLGDGWGCRNSEMRGGKMVMAGFFAGKFGGENAAA